MLFTNPIVVTLVGVFALMAGVWLVHHFFSSDARWERRRRRSHRRISTRSRRPMVRLSVRPDRKEGK